MCDVIGIVDDVGKVDRVAVLAVVEEIGGGGTRKEVV